MVNRNGGDSRSGGEPHVNNVEPKWTLVQLRRQITNVGGQGPPKANMRLGTNDEDMDVGEPRPAQDRTMNEQNEDKRRRRRRNLEKIQESTGCEELTTETK